MWWQQRSVLENSIGNNKNCITIDVGSSDNNFDNPTTIAVMYAGEGGGDDDDGTRIRQKMIQQLQ